MFSTPDCKPFQQSTRQRAAAPAVAPPLRRGIGFIIQPREGFRPEKPCQMESILILNANTADRLTADALLSGETTRPSWWVENFRESSLNKHESAGQNVSRPRSGTWFDPLTPFYLKTCLCVVDCVTGFAVQGKLNIPTDFKPITKSKYRHFGDMNQL